MENNKNNLLNITDKDPLKVLTEKPAEKKTGKSKKALIIIAIFVIILLLVGSYILIMNRYFVPNIEKNNIYNATNTNEITNENSGISIYSSMTIIGDKDVNILVTDLNGNSMGDSFIEEPIENEGEKFGIAVRMFNINTPPSGTYKVILSSPEKVGYFMDFILFGNNGEYTKEHFEGDIYADKKVEYILYLDKNNFQNATISAK